MDFIEKLRGFALDACEMTYVDAHAFCSGDAGEPAKASDLFVLPELRIRKGSSARNDALRAIVSGDGGSGKSMLANAICAMLARSDGDGWGDGDGPVADHFSSAGLSLSPGKVPILIRCRDIADEAKGKGFFGIVGQRMPKPSGSLEEWAKDRQEDIVLVIDGLDELSSDVADGFKDGLAGVCLDGALCGLSIIILAREECIDDFGRRLLRLEPNGEHPDEAAAPESDAWEPGFGGEFPADDFSMLEIARLGALRKPERLALSRSIAESWYRTMDGPERAPQLAAEFSRALSDLVDDVDVDEVAGTALGVVMLATRFRSEGTLSSSRYDLISGHIELQLSWRPLFNRKDLLLKAAYVACCLSEESDAPSTCSSHQLDGFLERAYSERRSLSSGYRKAGIETDRAIELDKEAMVESGLLQRIRIPIGPSDSLDFYDIGHRSLFEYLVAYGVQTIGHPATLAETAGDLFSNRKEEMGEPGFWNNVGCMVLSSPDVELSDKLGFLSSAGALDRGEEPNVALDLLAFALLDSEAGSLAGPDGWMEDVVLSCMSGGLTEERARWISAHSRAALRDRGPKAIASSSIIAALDSLHAETAQLERNCAPCWAIAKLSVLYSGERGGDAVAQDVARLAALLESGGDECWRAVDAFLELHRIPVSLWPSAMRVPSEPLDSAAYANNWIGKPPASDHPSMDADMARLREAFEAIGERALRSLWRSVDKKERAKVRDALARIGAMGALCPNAVRSLMSEDAGLARAAIFETTFIIADSEVCGNGLEGILPTAYIPIGMRDEIRQDGHWSSGGAIANFLRMRSFPGELGLDEDSRCGIRAAMCKALFLEGEIDLSEYARMAAPFLVGHPVNPGPHAKAVESIKVELLSLLDLDHDLRAERGDEFLFEADFDIDGRTSIRLPMRCRVTASFKALSDGRRISVLRVRSDVDECAASDCFTDVDVQLLKDGDLDAIGRLMSQIRSDGLWRIMLILGNLPAGERVELPLLAIESVLAEDLRRMSSGKAAVSSPFTQEWLKHLCRLHLGLAKPVEGELRKLSSQGRDVAEVLMSLKEGYGRQFKKGLPPVDLRQSEPGSGAGGGRSGALAIPSRWFPGVPSPGPGDAVAFVGCQNGGEELAVGTVRSVHRGTFPDEGGYSYDVLDGDGTLHERVPAGDLRISGPQR